MLEGPVRFVEIPAPSLEDNNAAMSKAIDHDASVGISPLEREFIWRSFTPQNADTKPSETFYLNDHLDPPDRPLNLTDLQYGSIRP